MNAEMIAQIVKHLWLNVEKKKNEKENVTENDRNMKENSEQMFQAFAHFKRENALQTHV